MDLVDPSMIERSNFCGSGWRAHPSTSILPHLFPSTKQGIKYLPLHLSLPPSISLSNQIHSNAMFGMVEKRRKGSIWRDYWMENTKLTGLVKRKRRRKGKMCRNKL